jgi:hypothetical protein
VPDQVAELIAEEDGLRVTPRRPDGTTGARRTIRGPHSCDDLADAVAVMLAAWQADAAAARERLPAPPPPVVRAVPVAPPRPPATSAGLRWELGAGGGVALAGGAVTPAALLSGAVLPGRRLGIAVRAQVSGDRRVSLPGGQARWRRALFALGPLLRLEGARAGADAHLGVGMS